MWICLVVQSLKSCSALWSPWTIAHEAPLSYIISQNMLKFMSIESVVLSNHLNPCYLLLVCLQFSPVSGLFQLVSSLHQVAKVLELYSWFPLELTGLISLQSKGLSRTSSNTKVQKHQFFTAQPSLWPNSHIPTWLLENPLTLTIQIFVSKVVSLLFNMLSWSYIASLPRKKHLLISWLQSPSTVILEPPKIKSITASTFPLSIYCKVMVLDAMVLAF